MIYFIIIFFFLFGMLLGYINASPTFKKEDGRFIVSETEEKISYRLDLNFDPSELKNHTNVVFKIYLNPKEDDA